MPDVIKFSALVSACETGKQPERALECSHQCMGGWLQEMVSQMLTPDAGSYNAAVSACEKDKQLERGPLPCVAAGDGQPAAESRRRELQCATMSARDKGKQWDGAPALLREMTC